MKIADHYTDLAMRHRATLPKDFLHLAWLDLDEEAGAEYWLAMNLAGRYASANHAVIHQKITSAIRLERSAPLKITIILPGQKRSTAKR